MLGGGENKTKQTDPKNLKYAIDGVPQEQSYDHYKNRVLQKQKSSKREDMDMSPQESAQHKQEKGKMTAAAKNKRSKESLHDSDDIDPDAISPTREEEK